MSHHHHANGGGLFVPVLLCLVSVFVVISVVAWAVQLAVVAAIGLFMAAVILLRFLWLLGCAVACRETFARAFAQSARAGKGPFSDWFRAREARR